FLLDGRHTDGNWSEAAAVAIHQCLTTRSLTDRMKRLWHVAVGDPAEYEFVVLSDGVDLSLGRLSLEELAETGCPDASGAFVLDLWLNVSCAISDYAARIRKETRMWQARGAKKGTGRLCSDQHFRSIPSDWEPNRRWSRELLRGELILTSIPIIH